MSGRGWTRLSSAIARRPVFAATTTFGAKYAVGDAIVQYTTSNNEIMDARRLGFFGGFGAYYGAVNYYVYRAVDKFPWGGPVRLAIGMSIFDIFIHLPFSFFPQFYFTRACIFREPRPSSGADLLECVQSGLRTWRENFLDDLKALMYIFTPIDLAMFSLPQHLRVPFLSCAGLIFPVVLSWMRGTAHARADDDRREQESVR